jgi:hypothetical protein
VSIPSKVACKCSDIFFEQTALDHRDILEMTRTLNSLLVLAAWAFAINLAAAGMCENVQKCLPTKFVTDKGTLTCEIKGSE